MKFAGPLRAVVAVAAGAGLVYGATAAGADVYLTRASDTAQQATATATGRSQLICPGPDRPGSPGADYTSQSVSVLTALAPGSVVPDAASETGKVTTKRLPSSSGGAPYAATSRGSVARVTMHGGGAAQVIGQGAGAAGLVAMQTARDEVKTARGLQLLQCTPPRDEAWLLAGGDQDGRLARLVLSNPGDGPISVDARVLGKAGYLETKSLQDVVVPANGRKVVVLGALGKGGAHSVIHVTSRGGVVQAAVVDRWLSGETRSGEELTGPAQDPATTQIVPAVAEVGADPVVRVGVPGHTDGIVRVRATNTSGKVVADEVVTVPAGSTDAVRLKDVPRGVYSVRVSADEPVVAGAVSRTGTSGTADFAWMPSAPKISTLTGFAVPPASKGARNTLVLSAPGKGAAVHLTTGSDDGKHVTKTVKIPGDHPVTIPLEDAATGWVDVTHGSVYAGLIAQRSDDSGALVSSTALHPIRARSNAVQAHAAQTE